MIGTVVDSRFEIEAEVGAGGMGRIMRATDRQTGRPVAVKVVSSPSALSIQRFAREAALLAELRHPGVVDYIAHGTLESGMPYIVMEWLDGADVSTWLRVRGVPSTAETLVLARRVASTLAAIHARGVVHRDVKPSNLFAPRGDLSRVKLIDFGTAREVAASRAMLTLQGEIVGTPFYMAPEQVRGDANIGPAADVWALGCVLYELVIGRPPFASPQPAVAMMGVLMDEPSGNFRTTVAPSALVDLIKAMMAKAPEARPASGADLLDALSQIEPRRESQPAIVSVTAPTQHPATQHDTGDASLGVASTSAPRAERELRERRVSVVVFGSRRNAQSFDPAALRAVAARHGADVTMFSDGYLVVTQRAALHVPTDQASRAATLALALRAAARDIALVVATVRGETADSSGGGARVDLALALVNRTLPGEISLDDTSARLLEAQFEIASGDGRPQLLGRRVSEQTRMLLGKPSPCVGRRRELAGLVATFEEAVESSVARAVLVTAAAGIGKSRLCSELLRELAVHSAPVEVLRGQGDSLSAGSPFVMIAPAVRRACGLVEGATLATHRAHLTERLGRSLSGADLDHVVPFIGELIGVPFPDDHSERLRSARSDPMLMGELTRNAFCDWLRAETADRAVLLVLEDLHWGDHPSIKLVDEALKALRDRPFIVVAFARPEVHATFPRLWERHEPEEVRLRALAPKACAEIARGALGSDIRDEIVAMIVARSQGNAFYLEELVRSAAQGAVDAIPDTVLGMVQARLYALDDDARRLLCSAAVFGEAFWEDGVRALLAGHDASFGVEEWLPELIRLELVIGSPESRLAGQREYRFRHALLRDGAYELLVEQDRAAHHLSAAAWLAKAGESDAFILAEHHERGGDEPGTIRMLARAVEQALEANDLGAVVSRAERAIAKGAEGTIRGELRAAQAVAAFWMAQYRETALWAGEATALFAEGSDAWFRAIANAMIAHQRLGDTSAFDRLLRSAEAAADDGVAQVVCLSRAAYQVAFRGDLEWARALIARILRLLEQAPAPPALVLANLNDVRAMLAMSVGDFRSAWDHQQRTIEAFALAGEVNNVLTSTISAAFLLLYIGDFGAAEKTYSQGLAAAESRGARQVVVLSRFGLAALRLQRGEPAAVQMMTEVVATFHASGHRRFEGWAFGLLAEHDFDCQRYEEALAKATRVIDCVRDTAILQPWAFGLAARCHIRLGQLTEAAQLVDKAMVVLDRLGGALMGQEVPPLARAELLHASGDISGARAAICEARDRLLARAATLDDTPWRATFLALRDNVRTLDLAAAWTGSAG